MPKSEKRLRAKAAAVRPATTTKTDRRQFGSLRRAHSPDRRSNASQ